MLVKGTLDMGCLLWVQCQYSTVVAVVLHAVACYIGACCTEVRVLSIARTELLINKDFAAFFMTGIPIRRYLYIETVPDRFVLICFCYCDKYIESTAMIGNWLVLHDDVIKWKHFPRYWPFVRVTGEFPSQGPMTRSFDVFFDLRLNKRLSKQSWGWWSRPFWRHCNMACHCKVNATPVVCIIHRMYCITSYVTVIVTSWGPFINKVYKMWDEITYPFPSLNGCTVEVCERMSSFILHFVMDVITYPCFD